MLINNVNYLLVERRGCEFHQSEEARNYSDIGNYRIFVHFTDKDGLDICGDFSLSRRASVEENRFFTDLQVNEANGDAHGYRPAGLDRFHYTEQGILDAVNSIAADHYDAIKYVSRAESIQPVGANFTGRQKVIEYANALRLKYFGHDPMLLEVRGDFYKYLCYEVKPIGKGRERVTVYLERASGNDLLRAEHQQDAMNANA